MMLPTALRAETSLDQALDKSRYTQEEQEQIRQVIDNAAEVGIGGELLLQRVHEARAKRVPAGRLIAALDQEVLRLEDSRTLLLETENGRTVLGDNAGWQRTANLMAWGAERLEISVLLSAIDGDIEKYLQASYLFTAFVQWGLSRGDSVTLSAAVAMSALAPDDYRGILEILIQSRRLRMQPDETATRLIDEMPDAVSLRQLKRKVLK